MSHPAESAHVFSLVFTPAGSERKPADHYARVPADRLTLAVRQGVVGDAKGGGGRRQLNVMRAETVADLRAEGFHAGPGELGEQVVVAGLEEADLAVGNRLRVGAAVIEVTLPRTGCLRFERIQGKAKQTVEGRLGVMARVVADGEVAVGDAVAVAAAAAAGV